VLDIIIILLVLFLTPASNICADPNWPMYLGDFRHSNRGSGGHKLPLQLEKSIRFDVPKDPEMRYYPEERSTPAVYEGIIYFGTAGKSLLAYDIETWALKWRFDIKEKIESPPALDAQSIYFGGGDGTFYCLNKENGKMRWKYVTKNEIRSAPIVVDGRVVFKSGDNLYAFEAKTGKFAWKYEAPEAIQKILLREHSSPAFSDGKVIAGFGSGYVVCLEMADGKIVWDVKISENSDFTAVSSSPMIDDSGRIYVSSYSEGMRCMDIADGKTVWKINSSNNSEASYEQDAVYFSSMDKGTVYAVNRLNGKSIWERKFKDNIQPRSPVIWGKILILTTSDNRIICLARDDGRTLWEYEIQGDVFTKWGISANPVIANNNLYIISNGGVLYIFKSETATKWEGFQKRF
jgi:outer membrane protein assembly factor BamB